MVRESWIFSKSCGNAVNHRRCGEVKALFEAPATPEIREYVAILARVVRMRANNNPDASSLADASQP